MTRDRFEKESAVQSKERLRQAAALTSAELFTRYSLPAAGLDEALVRQSREQYGSNSIARKKRDSVWKRLLKSFVTPFTIVLFVLAGISLFTDILLASPQERSYTTVAMVTAMVLISGLMTYVQEARSEQSAEKLTAMVRNTISVLREGQRRELPMNELVAGDHVYLASGDMIPADLRLIKTKDLFVSQSALTGESDPIEKFAEPDPAAPAALIECRNLAFMGSNVVSGAAEGIVIVTGRNTMFGALAEKLTGRKQATSFDAGINKVSWLLIRFILIMAPAVFLINGFFKSGPDRWLNALLFALSVAVGLTPEMLPMIVSANLAKGAVAMSRKKVIIKNLSSIQNFGAMDVLCTDKTGTLTEDRVALEYHCNTEGKEDLRILKHAFLNSYFETGLKNLMDLAIIRHAGEDALKPLAENYRKVDEIPFDFRRRRMSVAVADQSGKCQLITKGAIEEMLSVCAYAEYQGSVQPLSPELRRVVLDKVNDFNRRGFRVLGIAHKQYDPEKKTYAVADEADMVLIGYLAFLDPPKESSRQAIAKLQEYGVYVKILTGDNDAVTRYICSQVGIDASRTLLGTEIEGMPDEELSRRIDQASVFAKLTPDQKTRIVSLLRKKHVVGFMGDGINDAAAMKAADAGISVDTAVDIAKESADIILTEKDLNVLGDGIIEGRRTYANTIKYIKMTSSSNFGNMFSILAACIFLPFLPMLPIQLLILNMIYDISCLALPFDTVDADYLKIPRQWDASSVEKFMLWFGPASSVFDITTYLVMFFLICPQMFHGSYAALPPEKQLLFAALFQAGWFVESQWTQTLVIHTLRTEKTPVLQSMASLPVCVLSGLGILISTLLACVIGFGNGPQPLPLSYFVYLLLVIVLYSLLVSLIKKAFIRKYGSLL